MKIAKTILILALAWILLGSAMSFAATNYDSAELEEGQPSATAATYGMSGYSTFYNWSDPGKGNIYGVFERLNGSTWALIEDATVTENHWYETSAFGAPLGNIVYNFKSTISPKYNSNYYFGERSGLVVISAYIH